MKKGWVIFGTIMQLLLALLTFFMTIFSGGGFINRGGVSDFDIKVLELAILVLPCLCLISILSSTTSIQMVLLREPMPGTVCRC